jgi:hypothetical protein
VDVKSIEYPDEKQRSFRDRFDWIVMKLKKPIEGVTPYRLPTRTPKANQLVTAVSIRQEGVPHEDWNERVVTSCAIRKVVEIDAVAAGGLETDCDTGLKASGSPLLRPSYDGLEVVGIISSGTNACRKYRDRRCSSWAVGFTDGIVKAVERLAAMPSMNRPAGGGAGILPKADKQ